MAILLALRLNQERDPIIVSNLDFANDIALILNRIDEAQSRY